MIGGRVRNTPTSEGHIRWADDNRSLGFKEISFSPVSFRPFLRDQLALLQKELVALVFLAADPVLDYTQVPSFDLDKLRDNPSNGSTNWSFLQDPRNGLEKWKSWIIDRLLRSEALQGEFFAPIPHKASHLPQDPFWNARRIKADVPAVPPS